MTRFHYKVLQSGQAAIFEKDKVSRVNSFFCFLKLEVDLLWWLKRFFLSGHSNHPSREVQFRGLPKFLPLQTLGLRTDVQFSAEAKVFYTAT